MSKQTIIKSDDLKSLKVELVCEIDEAQNQIKVYSDEEMQQRRTKADQAVIDDKLNSQKFWINHRDTLHQCLVKIEKYSSEVEI